SNSPTTAIVTIFAKVHGIENANLLTTSGSEVGDRFDVVNTAAVPVVGATEEKTEFLINAKTLAESACSFDEVAAAFDWRVTTHAADADGGALAGSFRDKVYGAADAVAIHVGLQSFVDFDGLDDIGWDGVKFDLADAGLGRRNVDAVDGGVGETRLGAADLD